MRAKPVDGLERSLILSAGAITLVEPVVPAVHVPEFGRGYDPVTNTVACLRCRRMVDAVTWARPCPGIAKEGVA